MTPRCPSSSPRTAAAPNRSPSRRSSEVGRATAQEVAQYDGAGLLAGQPFELHRHERAHASEAFGLADRLADDRVLAPARLRSLGDDDDREPCAPLLPAGDHGCHGLQVEGDLRDQDGMGARRHAGVERDPTRVPAHDLDHEHPAVRGGGGEQPIDALGRHLDRGVEPEGGVSHLQVVVDGLGHADHAEAGVRELSSDGERSVAADRDQRLDPGVSEHADQLVGAVDAGPGPVGLLHGERRRISAIGTPEDSSTEMRDPRTNSRVSVIVPPLSGYCSGNINPLNPSRMPTTSHPRRRADRVAERITELSPGASPPPVEMAILTCACLAEPDVGPRARSWPLLDDPAPGQNRPSACSASV